MGGKTKHQRTKNNAKPSSSGRSAQLLASSNLPTSIGFANAAQFGFLPTAMQEASFTDNGSTSIEDMDPTLDTSYQMVFRKMTKKDPITKFKAIEEFNELLLKTKLNTIKSILPFWPRLYNNLSTDVEHRVREAAQQAQLTLMKQAGKNIAPYLKQITPAWITSQYDTYAPAASIAVQSFQLTFPAQKMQDVLAFCQNEILDYIMKNLIVHTAVTLSNPQSNTPEECEAKYQRVLICSLHGYELYLSKILPEHIQEVSNKNIALLENGKFWSYQKHKNPNIRAAWFGAICALLQSPLDLTKFEKQIITAAIQSLDECEASVIAHSWTAALLSMQQIQNWITYINIEKALIPKLRKILKSGGNGNGKLIYPHFLPLLSNLNHETLGEKTLKFYRDFFEHFNMGLCSKLSSQLYIRSDVTAISSSYFECLRYVLIQLQIVPIDNDSSGSDTENSRQFSLELMKMHVIDVISYILVQSNVNNAKHVCVHLVALIKFLKDNSGRNVVYNDLLNYFWSELFATIETGFNESADDQQIITKLNIVNDLVHHLSIKSTDAANKTNNTSKVRFVDSPVEEDVSKSNEMKTTDGPIYYFGNELNSLAAKLCQFYIKKTSDGVCDTFVQPLLNLIQKFGKTTAFYEQLAGCTDNIMKLYDKFASWLLLKDIRSVHVLDITLMLYPHLTSTDKSKLLNNLIKFPNDDVKNWTLSRILSHPLCADAEAIRLISHPLVIKQILKNAENIHNWNTNECINLLHKCFIQNENGDMMIDGETCCIIIKIICDLICDKTVAPNVLEACVSFLVQIMPLFCNDPKRQNIRDEIFTKLFALCVETDRLSILSEDIQWATVTSWQDALSSNDIELDENLLKICSECVEQCVKSTVENKNESIDVIESIAQIVSKLILCSVERMDNDDENKYQRADKVFETINQSLQPLFDTHLEECLRASAFIELVTGGMTAGSVVNKYLDYNLSSLDVYKNAYGLLKLATFKFSIIFQTTCIIPLKRKDTVNDDEKETDEENTEDYCDPHEMLLKKWSDLIYREIFESIYVGGIFNSFLHYFDVSEKLKHNISQFLDLISTFLSHVADDNSNRILELMIDLKRLEDPFFVKSLLLLKEFGPYRESKHSLILLHNDLIKTINGTENVNQYINVLLTFTPRLKLRQISLDTNIFNSVVDAHHRAIGLRCLIKNYFSSDYNEMGDQVVINECINLIDELHKQSKTNKEFLLYNQDISSVSIDTVLRIKEYIHLITDIIQYFPDNITETGWDFIRIAISSWVLTLSKSSAHWKSPKIAAFTITVYKMVQTFNAFIESERKKSSTKQMIQVVDEWEQVFAKDVNLILLKCFIKFVEADPNIADSRQEYFLGMIGQSILNLNFKYVQVSHKVDSKISVDDLMQFALTNLLHTHHAIRVACNSIINNMAKYFIEKDLDKSGSLESNKDGHSVDLHLLHKFSDILHAQDEWIQHYINEFDFKLNELDDCSEIPEEKSISFLMIWHCILNICEIAPSEIRSLYAAYLKEQRFDETCFKMLFRMMPAEILRNQDLKLTGNSYFAPLPWKSIVEKEFTSERYACYVYVQTLKTLPAVVRRWWNESNARQKTLVDKITTVFVSPQLCSQQLLALNDKMKKQDSFQISVHASTREVHATYSIDEARMELIIQLPLNYPLGVIKVNCGQQIGDKLQSRAVVMQLSIFLTHQNGSIWDGLSLWRRNLDKKFDGIEECFVCYSVIHQETCQLPKLTCKTCKKKFHGQCLYKWFNTSNKSTCPICRNIF